MIGNTLQVPKQQGNSLTATIDSTGFVAAIVGGRYDEGPTGGTEWIRRSWGRGPLLAADNEHVLIFISINWDITGENTYDLSDDNLPVSVMFTNRFPPADGNEFDHLVLVESGSLKITHSADTFIAEGTFEFVAQIPQSDETTLRVEVKEGKFIVGPTK